MLADVESGSIELATQALLALTYHDPDLHWVEDILLVKIRGDTDDQVRRLSITCLGHLARIHADIDRAKVLPVLNELLDDRRLGGVAEDALDDISNYAGGREPNDPMATNRG
jgi:hypothetical protein